MPNETYLLCHLSLCSLRQEWYPVLRIDGFTEEEGRWLTELLQGQHDCQEYKFKVVTYSKHDGRELIEVRRQWHALERYCQELCMGRC